MPSNRGVHWTDPENFDPLTYDPEEALHDPRLMRYAQVYFMFHEGYKRACIEDAPIQRLPLNELTVQGMMTALHAFLLDMVGWDRYNAWLNTIREQMKVP